MGRSSIGPENRASAGVRHLHAAGRPVEKEMVGAHGLEPWTR